MIKLDKRTKDGFVILLQLLLVLAVATLLIISWIVFSGFPPLN